MENVLDEALQKAYAELEETKMFIFQSFPILSSNKSSKMPGRAQKSIIVRS